jgi:hypothetical protein
MISAWQGDIPTISRSRRIYTSASRPGCFSADAEQGLPFPRAPEHSSTGRRSASSRKTPQFKGGFSNYSPESLAPSSKLPKRSHQT